MSDEWPIAGTLLAARYRLVTLLETGGMSEIWRADDELLARPVAVKLPTGAQVVWREARMAAKLSHPNIAAVHDYREAVRPDGTVAPFVVMELLAGESVAARLEHEEIGLPEAARIGAAVADALAAAHANGVVHRDIKPGNVMLTPNGVKILDFGISATAGEPDDDDTGSTFGTPAYVAPERLDGMPAEPATDVYGLGVLLFEMVTGDPPYPVDTWEELAIARASGPRVLPAELPAAFRDIVGRCLADSPDDRPGADEVRFDLTALWLKPTPEAALRPADLPRARPDEGPADAPTAGSSFAGSSFAGPGEAQTAGAGFVATAGPGATPSAGSAAGSGFAGTAGSDDGLSAGAGSGFAARAGSGHPPSVGATDARTAGSASAGAAGSSDARTAGPDGTGSSGARTGGSRGGRPPVGPGGARPGDIPSPRGNRGIRTTTPMSRGAYAPGRAQAATVPLTQKPATRRWILGVTVVALLAAVGGVLTAVNWPKQTIDANPELPPPVVVSLPPPPTQKPTSAPATTQSFSPTPKPTRTLDFDDAVSRFRTAVEDSNLRSDVETDLLNFLQPLANANRNNVDAQLDALRRKINDRAGEGTIPAARATLLRSRLTDVTRAAGM